MVRFKITIETKEGYQAPYTRDTKVTTERGKIAWMNRTIRQIMRMETVKGVEVEVVD
ncbi:hypothetical protein [Klebsiella pneumoniae]|uniref:hypothetical protein n=1 Tax=Klebsiella pneumoniae TaxID=573 RepID=UPI003854818B